MTPKKSDFGRWLNQASRGMGAVLGPIILGGWAGQWLDHHWQHPKPWLTVILLTLGAITGLYSLIKMAATDK